MSLYSVNYDMKHSEDELVIHIQDRGKDPCDYVDITLVPAEKTGCFVGWYSTRYGIIHEIALCWKKNAQIPDVPSIPIRLIRFSGDSDIIIKNPITQAIAEQEGW